MEWVFLVLWTNSGLAVMPERYPAEQCKKFQDESTKGYVLCIPTPKLTIMKDESKVEQFGFNEKGGNETFTYRYKDCTLGGSGAYMTCPNPFILPYVIPKPDICEGECMLGRPRK